MAPYMLSWCVLELLCFVVVCCCSAIRSVKHAVLRVVMCAVICALMCAEMYNAMRAAMRAVLCAANYVRLNYIEKIRDKTLSKVTRHKCLPFKMDGHYTSQYFVYNLYFKTDELTSYN